MNEQESRVMRDMELRASSEGVPHLIAFVDFDVNDTTPMVLGSDPMDMSGLDGIDYVPISTVGSDAAMVTICARREESGRVAGQIAGGNNAVSYVARNHAEGYAADGVEAFAIKATDEGHIRRMQQEQRAKQRREGIKARLNLTKGHGVLGALDCAFCGQLTAMLLGLERDEETGKFDPAHFYPICPKHAGDLFHAIEAETGEEWDRLMEGITPDHAYKGPWEEVFGEIE